MFRHLFLLMGWLSLPLVLVPALGSQPGIWLDVPFVKQEGKLCGAACIAMVLRYWSPVSDRGTRLGSPGRAPGQASHRDVASIGKQLYSGVLQGIRGRDMATYFEKEGFRAFIFKAEWPQIQSHLAKGRPLIICLTNNGTSHYVVVAGFIPSEDVVLVNDPARRKLLKMERDSFERAWTRAAHWTLLALPKSSSE